MGFPKVDLGVVFFLITGLFLFGTIGVFEDVHINLALINYFKSNPP